MHCDFYHLLYYMLVIWFCSCCFYLSLEHSDFYHLCYHFCLFLFFPTSWYWFILPFSFTWHNIFLMFFITVFIVLPVAKCTIALPANSGDSPCSNKVRDFCKTNGMDSIYTFNTNLANNLTTCRALSYILCDCATFQVDKAKKKILCLKAAARICFSVRIWFCKIQTLIFFFLKLFFFSFLLRKTNKVCCFWRI